MHKFPIALNRLLGLAAVFLMATAALSAETAYFLMSGPGDHYLYPGKQSYVIAVSDPALIQQARDYLKAGGGAPYLIPHVKIANGSDTINLDYAKPGHPAWNWHATQLIEWVTYDPNAPRTAQYTPNVEDMPAQVPDLLFDKGIVPPYDNMTLIHYPLVMELTPGDAAKLDNVSTRGWVGSGDKVLIAGFIVQGGEPQNVVVRGLGPSLTKLGVSDALADPVITIYRGSTEIATNDNWQDGDFVPLDQIPEGTPPWYSWLFPTDPKESAIRLSLPPGAYTVHLSGANGGTGIGLVEVYNLDSLNPQ